LWCSAIVEAAWAGKLVHLSGLDVIGPTAGALARLVQDRETELWAGKRIVGEATPTEVCPLSLLFSLHLSSPTPTLMPLVLVSQIDSGASTLSLAHPSFRLIATASKSLPLKDWLSAEHANMFFPVPAQPMGRVEEEAILLATGCAPRAVKRMLAFAERYRASMSEDSVQKNRKLGTRSLVRVARRMAVVDGGNGDEGDLRAVLSRTLLLEFLPAVERMNVEQLFDEAGIVRVTPAVCAIAQILLFLGSHLILIVAQPQPFRAGRRARLPGPEHERRPVVRNARPALQRRGRHAWRQVPCPLHGPLLR
jgi:hypothetical protein